MPNMRTTIFLLLSGATLMACFPPPPDGRGGGNNTPVDANPGVNPCTRLGATADDGFPFDVAAFESDIRPPLAGCQLAASCHAPGNVNRFTVFTDGDCPDIQTFNEVFALSDYEQGGAASRMVLAIDGTLAAHPVKPPAADALVATLRQYIDTAKETFEQGGSVAAGLTGE